MRRTSLITLVILLVGIGNIVAACGGNGSSGSLASDAAPAAGAAGTPEVGRDAATGGEIDHFFGLVAPPPPGGAACLPRALAVVDGLAQCELVEAKRGGCDCAAPARTELKTTSATELGEGLAVVGACTAASGQNACADYCMCAIPQEAGAALSACIVDAQQASQQPSARPGFCYVDQPTPAALVHCDPAAEHLLEFVSPAASPTPSDGATLILACWRAAGPGQ